MPVTCPYCSKEMKKGSIMQTESFRPLSWLPDDRVIGVKELFRKLPKIKLTSTVSPYLPMHYCEDCRKFLVDMEEIEV